MCWQTPSTGLVLFFLFFLFFIFFIFSTFSHCLASPDRSTPFLYILSRTSSGQSSPAFSHFSKIFIFFFLSVYLSFFLAVFHSLSTATGVAAAPSPRIHSTYESPIHTAWLFILSRRLGFLFLSNFNPKKSSQYIFYDGEKNIQSPALRLFLSFLFFLTLTSIIISIPSTAGL